MRFGTVFRASWVVPGLKVESVLDTIWQPFSAKNRKKTKRNQYGHRALSRSAPRTPKKRFLRGSENVLFFGWFFHWKWLTFGGHVQWKNHSKIHADFDPEKGMIFDDKSMQKLLEFLHCFIFLFFWFVFEKCLMQNTVLKPMNFQCF